MIPKTVSATEAKLTRPRSKLNSDSDRNLIEASSEEEPSSGGQTSPVFNSSSLFNSSPEQFLDSRRDRGKIRPAVASPGSSGNFKNFFIRKKLLGTSSKSPFGRPFVSPASKPLGLKRESFYKSSGRPVTKSYGKIMEIRRQKKSVPLSNAVEGLFPESYSSHQLIQYGVLKETWEVSAENAADFYFSPGYLSENESELEIGDGLVVSLDSAGGISADQIHRSFLNSPGVDGSLIPDGWVENHYRWIVYKLAALEVGFPLVFGGKQLTPDRVAYQLKYRYDREIDMAQRSALRRILEGDDSIGRPLVVFVSKILTGDSGTDHQLSCTMEVSDGWYAVKAEVDKFLCEQVVKGNICVGTKLFLIGASIQGFQGGHHPLELPDSVFLCLEGNCVRRARWDARLGFYSGRRLPCFPLVSLFPHGGLVSAQIRLVVSRLFPVQFLEKFPDGRVIFRNGTEEQKVASEFDRVRMAVIERMAETVYKNAKAEFSQDMTQTEDESTADWSSGEGIYNILKKTPDPFKLHTELSAEQQELLNRFLSKKRDLQMEGLRSRMEAAIKEHEDEIPVRKVSVQMKIVVRGLHPADTCLNAGAILTVYNPGEELLDFLKHGKKFCCRGVTAREHTNTAHGYSNSEDVDDGASETL